jgi:hypothetical protein
VQIVFRWLHVDADKLVHLAETSLLQDPCAPMQCTTPDLRQMSVSRHRMAQTLGAETA